MIPVRFRCPECDKDLGVYWYGINDENEPRPYCCGRDEGNLPGSSDPNIVRFGWD